MPVFRSPAKINLFLRILNKRPDGYHEIASVFQAISLFDYLSIELANEDAFNCTDVHLPVDASNLVIKALRLFRQKTGKVHPVSIKLEKNIPSEAGLGGGSSNAATTLWALNELMDRPAKLEQLKQWASEIGSDVPFFLSQGSAYCTGKGEVMADIPVLPTQNVVIIQPPYGLSTPKVYQALKINNTLNKCPQVMLQALNNGEPVYYNDLERPAFALIAQLKEIKTELSHSFQHVLMSGSGTCFFCLTPLKQNFSISFLKYEAQFLQRPVDSWY